MLRINFNIQQLAGLILLGILAVGLRFRMKNLFSRGEFYP